QTEAIFTSSTTWPQSCAVAEAAFFRHVATHAQEDSFHLRCMQACACILVGYNFSAYKLKTVVLHLLAGTPLESWHKSILHQRMDDIVQYLRRFLEEKHLDHFLTGNEAVPAEIVFPQGFEVARLLSLFQHLVQEPANHVWVLCEFKKLQDRLMRLLTYG
ncbi:IPIL1 protein, partial [Alectura lathami]|nr:IPIL1 protein [Alectura lathami]